MDANLTSAFALKNAVAIAVVSCLIAGGFTAAVTTAGAARSAQPGTVSVNRTNKGDRLPREVTLNRASAISAALMSAARRPPIGCDPAFSPIVDPARAHIFGRCIS
jgi:hypothetical protein